MKKYYVLSTWCEESFISRLWAANKESALEQHHSHWGDKIGTAFDHRVFVSDN